MSDSGFGLTEAVAITLGGRVGGGRYAVLGVVTPITGAATRFAFVLACVVAIYAVDSSIWLNELVVQRGGRDGGGSVTFVRSFTGNSTLAGMVGRALLVEYIGVASVRRIEEADLRTAADITDVDLPDGSVDEEVRTTSGTSIRRRGIFNRVRIHGRQTSLFPASPRTASSEDGGSHCGGVIRARGWRVYRYVRPICWQRVVSVEPTPTIEVRNGSLLREASSAQANVSSRPICYCPLASV